MLHKFLAYVTAKKLRRKSLMRVVMVLVSFILKLSRVRLFSLVNVKKLHIEKIFSSDNSIKHDCFQITLYTALKWSTSIKCHIKPNLILMS